MTNHDIGATFAYHGQRVLFEWQSLQERSRIAVTCGSRCICDSSAIDCSITEFVFAGRLNCAITNKHATTISSHFTTLKSLVFIAMQLLNLRFFAGLQILPLL